MWPRHLRAGADTVVAINVRRRVSPARLASMFKTWNGALLFKGEPERTSIKGTTDGNRIINVTKQLFVVSNMAFYVQSTITVTSGRQLFLKGYIFVKRLHLTVGRG